MTATSKKSGCISSGSDTCLTACSLYKSICCWTVFCKRSVMTETGLSSQEFQLWRSVPWNLNYKIITAGINKLEVWVSHSSVSLQIIYLISATEWHNHRYKRSNCASCLILLCYAQKHLHSGSNTTSLISIQKRYFKLFSIKCNAIHTVLTSTELILLGTTPTAVKGIGSPDARRRRRKQHKARFTTPSKNRNKAFNRFTIKAIAIAWKFLKCNTDTFGIK